MKLLILGATGGTGRHLIEPSLAAGHEVTVVVRDPATLPDEVDVAKLTVLTGDATVSDDVARAVDGQEGVLNAIGSRSVRHPVEKAVSDLLVPRAEAAGVRRLVVCSAFGVGDTREDASLASRAFFSTVLRRVYADKEVADARVRASTLDWTLVYPTRLTDDPPKGDFQTVEHLESDGVPRISRVDVARFMVAQLEDDTWSRRTVVISDRPGD